MDSTAFCVFASLWAQMRLIRLCVLIVSREETLIGWLRSTGLVGAYALAAQLMCIYMPCASTFASLLISTLALGWRCLPYEVDNSGTYGLLADGNLLTGIAWAWVHTLPPHVCWQMSLPIARSIFFTTYCFAALAKLNRDYFKIRRSATTTFSLLVFQAYLPRCLQERLLAAIGDVGVIRALRLGIVVLVIVEFLMPVGLIVSRATGWGDVLYCSLTLVWYFHLALATVAYDYSTIAVASIALCVPPRCLENLAWATIGPGARGMALAASVGLLVYVNMSKPREKFSPLHVAAVAYLVRLRPAMWLPSPNSNDFIEDLTPSVGWCRTLEGLWLIATIANGAGPYLGYKTVGVWAMFSNLHVEGGWTNHLLMRSMSWQVFHHCRDLVTVLETDSPILRQYHTVSQLELEVNHAVTSAFAKRNKCALLSHSNSVLGRSGADDASFVLPYRVPYWQLRRMISTECLPKERSFFVDYRRMTEGSMETRRFEALNGQVLGDSDGNLATPPPMLLRKLISFKSVPLQDSDCGVCHGP